MSLKSQTQPENGAVTLEIEIDKVTFETAVSAQFRKNAPKMNIPGFRKGKAPRNIVEKMYGKGVFYEDALNDLMPSAYEEALKESGIDPVSRPEMDIVSMDENGVVVSAKVYVMPTVTMSEYKGLTADRETFEITDEEIDAELEKVRKRNARTINIEDRAAVMGDKVTFDFEGFKDDVPFDGGKAEKHVLTLGSGQFIPGFEEQVVGKSIGEDFDVDVTFPEDYHAEELKGAPVKFVCHLHEIKSEELPELDDEFAKDASEFATLDEYKADIKAKLTTTKQNASDRGVEEQLIDGIIAAMSAEIPEVMYESEVDNQVQDYEYRLRSQGLDLQTFFQYTGQTIEQMREQFKPQAERQVKARLALEEIVKLEALEPTEAEYEEEYARLATAYTMEVDKIKESLTKEMMAKDINMKKALDLVKAAAVVTDKAPEVVEAVDAE